MKIFNNGYVELLDHMGNDLDIVNAARKSFDNKSEKFGISDFKLLGYLWKNGHTSPFEMVEFKFAVKAPLFVIRQWQRHRTWSYNETSRRYTDDDIEFYVPAMWRKQSKDNKQSSFGEVDTNIDLTDYFEYCFQCYKDLLLIGVCREQARMVLPQNMMVKMIAKVDLNNLLKFLKLRNHPHAQQEMQEYARGIEKLIEPIVPETMKLYRRVSQVATTFRGGITNG